jgi:hypothetical protein
MSEQNYGNHSRFSFLWHVITPLIILAILTINIIQLCKTGIDNLNAWSFIGITIVLLLLWGYTRWFALRAQDRAIRAEERFRHFIITGDPIDPALRMGQIIALRFASDAELPGLARRAVKESLTPKQIKQAIVQWKADTKRV